MDLGSGLEVVTTRTLAKRLGIHPETLRRKVREGVYATDVDASPFVATWTNATGRRRYLVRAIAVRDGDVDNSRFDELRKKKRDEDPFYDLRADLPKL